MSEDNCILRKANGPWYDRKASVATVICGIVQAERYVKEGYQFDWQAMREAHLRGALASPPEKPAPADEGLTVVQGDHAAITEQALMFRRFWEQEKTRAERLDNEVRALRNKLDALSTTQGEGA